MCWRSNDVGPRHGNNEALEVRAIGTGTARGTPKRKRLELVHAEATLEYRNL